MIDAYIKLLRLLALSALDAPEPTCSGTGSPEDCTSRAKLKFDFEGSCAYRCRRNFTTGPKCERRQVAARHLGTARRTTRRLKTCSALRRRYARR
jgi:hypothetical protein